MVVPAIGVVVGENHGRVLPVRLLLQKVDDLNDERLLVERIGVARVAILIGRRLQETDRRKVARLHRIEEVVGVVLMVGRIAVVPDHLDRGRPHMLQVRRLLVILEGLVMWDCSRGRQPSQSSNACCAGSRWCRSGWSASGRSRLQTSPRSRLLFEQHHADVVAGEVQQRARGRRTDVADGVAVADHR